jgi:hypothetical protein
MKSADKKMIVLIILMVLVCFQAIADDISQKAMARVVQVKCPGAIDNYLADPNKVRLMVQTGLVQLTGASSVSRAWATLVSTNDMIGIKVWARPGTLTGTRTAVVESVILDLINLGVPKDRIIIWDKRMSDLKVSGFDKVASRTGVRLAGAAESGYSDTASYENSLVGNLAWGDKEFGSKSANPAKKSYVTKLMTSEITKVISIVPLLNHPRIDCVGHLYSMAIGSVDNTGRFESDKEKLVVAVPEIFALEEISNKTVLFITDALICQYEGYYEEMLHYSDVLNQLWFSKDPVALDLIATEEIGGHKKNKGDLLDKNMLIYNASLLELGVGSKSQIQIENIKLE